MGPVGAQAENHCRAVSARDCSRFVEAPELASARRMAQLAQRLRLDLPDPLPGDREAQPDLLQRQVGRLPDPEPEPQDLLLTRRERAQDLTGLAAQVARQRRVEGGDRPLVLDEVAEVAVVLLPDRCLERDRLAGDAEHTPDLVGRQLHMGTDLLGRGLAPELLDERARHAHQLVDGLDHVHGDADRARLVGDRTRDGLPDPPRGVSRELVPALVLELLDRAHEAHVPFLDQVEELKSAVEVALGDRYHEAEVGLDELLLGVVRPHACRLDLLDDPDEHRRAQTDGTLELARLALRGAALRLGLVAAVAAARALVRQAADTGLQLSDTLGGTRQLVDHGRYLAPAQPEIEQARRQTLLDAGELRGTTRAFGGAAPSAASAERLALGDEPADARELDQEAPALAGVLGGLTLLLGIGAGPVAHPGLAGSQPLREAEDVTKADRRRQRGTERTVLTFLDPLGDRDLALTRQQRRLAHLAHVEAHRVAAEGIADLVPRRLVLLAGVVGHRLDVFGIGLVEGNQEIGGFFGGIGRCVDGQAKGLVGEDVLRGCGRSHGHAPHVRGFSVRYSCSWRCAASAASASPRASAARSSASRRPRARRSRRRRIAAMQSASMRSRSSSSSSRRRLATRSRSSRGSACSTAPRSSSACETSFSAVARQVGCSNARRTSACPTRLAISASAAMSSTSSSSGPGARVAGRAAAAGAAGVDRPSGRSSSSGTPRVCAATVARTLNSYGSRRRFSRRATSRAASARRPTASRSGPATSRSHASTSGSAPSSSASTASGPRARTKVSGSSPAGRNTPRPHSPASMKTGKLRAAARRPAASPSKQAITRSVKRRSTRSWSAVSAVPSGATTSPMPAWARAIRSRYPSTTTTRPRWRIASRARPSP